MKNNQYEKASDLTKELLSISHSEIKRKLDAEKQAKKREKFKKSSASARVSDDGF